MIKQDAVNATNHWGREFHHRTLRNSDGTPCRCRANGKCITWKTRPEEFRLPVKYGLSGYGYITERNAGEWCLTAGEALGQVSLEVVLSTVGMIKSGAVQQSTLMADPYQYGIDIINHLEQFWEAVRVRL
jgi:hypothetical protein